MVFSSTALVLYVIPYLLDHEFALLGFLSDQFDMFDLISSETFFVKETTFRQMNAVQPAHILVEQVIVANEAIVCHVGTSEVGIETGFAFVSLQSADFLATA